MSFSGKKKYRNSPDINVTPFVDILLVLLITFMAVSPILVSGVNVDLPNGQSLATPDGETKNVVISINESGEIFFNDILCKDNELLQKFKSLDTKKTAVFVRGDRKIVYSKIMDVINISTLAGFDNVVLVTQDDQE